MCNMCLLLLWSSPALRRANNRLQMILALSLSSPTYSARFLMYTESEKMFQVHGSSLYLLAGLHGCCTPIGPFIGRSTLLILLHSQFFGSLSRCQFSLAAAAVLFLIYHTPYQQVNQINWLPIACKHENWGEVQTSPYFMPSYLNTFIEKNKIGNLQKIYMYWTTLLRPDWRPCVF